MNLRKWFYLFFTTMLVGMAASVLVAIYLFFSDENLQNTDVTFLGFMFANAGAGMMFSVLSQMGFFAYLTVNYIARYTIRRRPIWDTLQIIITLIVLVDLVVLPHLFLEPNSLGLAGFFILPLILLVLSVIVANWKSNLTNSSAFIPTVFFLIVATALEAVPALKENELETIIFMIVPLYCCNAWQILNLHRLVKKEEQL